MPRLTLTLTLEQWKKKRVVDTADEKPPDRQPMIGETRPCFYGDCGGRQVYTVIERLGERYAVWRCPSCARTERE